MDIFSTGAIALITLVGGWAGAGLKFRADQRRTDAEQGDRLEIHRDDLTFELLQAAREEIATARLEARDAREEIAALRPLERDFYHVQQALDHLDALLYGPEEGRRNAERNAKAFLTRIRRLHEARGTIANEVQRADSQVSLAERSIDQPEKK